MSSISAQGQTLPPDPQILPPDPAALLRSTRYVRILLLAALLGVPISALSYGFLAIVGLLQPWVYADLPGALGLTAPPWWWTAPPLVLAGLLICASPPPRPRTAARAGRLASPARASASVAARLGPAVVFFLFPARSSGDCWPLLSSKRARP